MFTDFRVLEDSITMVKLNLFRPLAHDRPPMDEAMEEDMYSDPQWPHLLVVYQFYLDLVRNMCCSASPVSAASQSLSPTTALPPQVSYDIDLTMKKKVVDASFIDQLVPLFDSQDPRERDMLKVGCGLLSPTCGAEVHQLPRALT